MGAKGGEKNSKETAGAEDAWNNGGQAWKGMIWPLDNSPL